MQRLETTDLVHVANGLHQMLPGIGNIGNQPRIAGNEDARVFFDSEFNRAGDLLEMAIEELRHRPVSGDRHIDEERLRIIATADLLDFGEAILDVVAFLSKGFESLSAKERSS
ncbi:hypothetical protein U0C82_14390 [Fulvimarina sp. 2208YS6-2-32]|uniref:Uncharacterized protein n=1 Tax=Fulvimarina uroteuthidis TaxID=3098149 RepID=A0ABU5I5Z2_9HYPH|nr:hypothetical protein [Fulvimarina sp. 2208YS6-2-32]MDY8110328.1 hypothetical protein [Fulvimarina sp. 2208YS6-2-32]